MKKLISISVFISMMLSSLVMYSQKDSISLQREARKLVREGNKLYNQKKYADATISYKKALEKIVPTQKQPTTWEIHYFKKRILKKPFLNTKF